MPRSVRATAEWALWGRRAADQEHGVLACSDQGLRAADFDRIVNRFATGAPVSLPQVTLAWAGGAVEARVILLIQEQGDGALVDTRVFALKYTDLAQGPVSYEDLYEALQDVGLPREGPIEVELPALDAARIAARLTKQAMGTAVLLLTGEAVCVVEDGLSLRERLRRLDDVAALLPYGMRARLSAATWTSGTAAHRIRLSFSQAPQDAQNVYAGQFVPLPPDAKAARRYLELLASYENKETLVATLAAADEPMHFGQADLAVAALDGTARAPVGVPVEAVEGFVVALLERCAAALEQGDTTDLLRAVEELKSFTAVPHADEQRARYRRVLGERRLLAEGPGLDERVRAELYGALLGPAIGDHPTEAALKELRAVAGGRLHGALAAALWRSFEDGREEFRLDRDLTEQELSGFLTHLPFSDLVELAARESTEQALFLSAVEALEERAARESRDRRGSARMARALQGHGHLAGAVERHLPGDGEAQHRLLSALLQAAYGEGFGFAELERILSGSAVSFPALVTAAIASYRGTGAGEAFARSFLTGLVERQSLTEESGRAVLDKLAPAASAYTEWPRPPAAAPVRRRPAALMAMAGWVLAVAALALYLLS
ncbi:hypothetical protein [Actinocorallia libanotica]|uniref:Uncharacterized protein n=1 Tax=Actinocorallia libanotica TaxID=46162 RepID=A0ABN1QUI0_9ACTN